MRGLYNWLNTKTLKILYKYKKRKKIRKKKKKPNKNWLNIGQLHYFKNYLQMPQPHTEGHLPVSVSQLSLQFTVSRNLDFWQILDYRATLTSSEIFYVCNLCIYASIFTVCWFLTENCCVWKCFWSSNWDHCWRRVQRWRWVTRCFYNVTTMSECMITKPKPVEWNVTLWCRYNLVPSNHLTRLRMARNTLKPVFH